MENTQFLVIYTVEGLDSAEMISKSRANLEYFLDILKIILWIFSAQPLT